MGRTVTFSELRELIRIRYDLPDFTTQTFVSLPGINSMINSSLQAYYGLLCECYGDDYFAATSTLSTVADTATTDLPSRFVKLKSLVWERATDDLVTLRRAQAADSYLAGMSQQSWEEYLPRYRIFGTSKIRWFPKPNAVYTVICDFVQLPADLVDGTDTFEAGPGHEEWVVLDVCRKIAQREEKPVNEWAALRGEAEARIRAQAPDRDETEGLVLRDAYNRGESDYARWNRYTLGDY